jgi:hypothetical protein
VRRIGVRAGFLLVAALHAALPASAAEPRVITDPAQSARPAALRILKHLAAGELASAAAFSNAPERRLEVLRQFRESVGDERFMGLFGRYFAPENRIVMEAAVGRHRLLVWDLGEAGHELVGQYFVEVDGGFVMDDVPNAERRQLQRLLADVRSSK